MVDEEKVLCRSLPAKDEICRRPVVIQVPPQAGVTMIHVQPWSTLFSTKDGSSLDLHVLFLQDLFKRNSTLIIGLILNHYFF